MRFLNHMGGRRRKTAEYTWRSRLDQSLHFRKNFCRRSRASGARIMAARAFNQHGIAELVRAIASAVERVVRAAKDGFVGERLQQLVMARARLMGAGEDRVHDPQ